MILRRDQRADLHGGSATPGSESVGSGTVDTELPLDVTDRGQYESAAGTLVRAALDRPDIERSVKRAMANLMT